jgi:hypothetical protein
MGLSNPVVITIGTQVWLRDGVIHRDGGPAIIYSNGMQEWYRDGLLHRDDGPASISSNVELWYQNGIQNRSNGPAITYKGAQGWYRNGIDITAEVQQWIIQQNLGDFTTWTTGDWVLFKLTF